MILFFVWYLCVVYSLGGVLLALLLLFRLFYKEDRLIKSSGAVQNTAPRGEDVTADYRF